MQSQRLSRYASTACVAVALLAGCGGSQMPIGSPLGPLNAAVGKDETLLYITDEAPGSVYMVALPSGRLVGKLTGFDYATGECADQHGNVFISDEGAGQIRAYAHGSKTAFRVLKDSSWAPFGCSVDQTTGNFAVCNVRTGQTLGTIAVYLKAKGRARHYRYRGVNNFWNCAYDGDGNLFADAVDYGSYSLIVLELPKGRDNLQIVTLSPALPSGYIPPLFWDGKDLAIAAPSSGEIYQYRIRGSTGTRVNVVKLGGASEVTGPFWITTNGTEQTLYAPIVEHKIESVGVYRYPAGGKRLKNLYDVPHPGAAAVSAPR